MLANMHSTTLLYCSTGIYFFRIFYSSSTIYLVFLILLLPFLFSSCSSFPSFSSSSPLPLFLHFLYHLCSYSFNLLFHPSRESEICETLSSTPACSIEQIPVQPQTHRETPSWKEMIV